MAEVFGDVVVYLVEVAVLAAWLVASAVVIWRRTPLRGVPVLFVGMAVFMVSAAWWFPRFADFVEADPWRLTWTIPAGLTALAVANSAAHKYDARQYPRAHERFVEAQKNASWVDRMTFQSVPTIVIDPFGDPSSR